MIRRLCSWALGACCLLLFATAALRATETENQLLRVVPAPGKVPLDGKGTGWDLRGGIFTCADCERFREHYAVWFFAMYDADNLYLMARWKDPTPLDNQQSSKGGRGFAGDCLQVRCISGYKTPNECVTHLTCWRDRDGLSDINLVHGRDFKGGELPNAENDGARQAFSVDADGQGYTQELSIPWKLLTKDGAPLSAGAELRMAIEPNFTAGPGGRISIKDIFRAGITPDRVFTFRAYDAWGPATLVPAGELQPAPLRLADGREFPVTLAAKGAPAIDWTGLIVAKTYPGFKPIAFDLPFDGKVSLNLYAPDGTVARQLLTASTFQQGHHEVMWDGLTTPHWRTPGTTLPAGDYHWEAIATRGLAITLRGYAVSGGIPWHNGPTTGWGGDHGVPDAVATDATHVYLGWSFAEAGKPLIATDFTGKVVWKSGSGLVDSSQYLAVDKDIVYTLGVNGGIGASLLVRLRAKDGVFYDNWPGHSDAGLPISDLWAGKPDAGAWPDHADGMDVKNGAIYLGCSGATLSQGDILDWKALITKLMTGDPLSVRLLAAVHPDTTKRLKDFLAGKATQAQAFGLQPGGHHFNVECVRELNLLLAATDVAPGTADLSSEARALANRRFLEQHFAPAIQVVKTGLLVVADAQTGALRQTVDVPFLRSVHAVSDTLVYGVVEGKSVVAINPQTGAVKPVVTGLVAARVVTAAADGRIFVALGAPANQVQIFTPDGKPAGSVGKAGGRALLGPWQPEGLYAIGALALDPAQHLWVMDADNYPKRVSTWDPATGKLLQDFFGAAHYGASGGAIDPLDPNLMIGEGCEWRLDPKTGQAACVGIVDRMFHAMAVISHASNGRTYLVTDTEAHGPRDWRVYERLAPGQYVLRANIMPSREAKTTTFWSDANGDGEQQPDEVQTLPAWLQITGSNAWSINVNRADLSLYGVAADQQTVYRVPASGFTACGAPVWDVPKAQALPFAYGKGLVQASGGMLPSLDNKLLVTCEQDDFKCYEVATGKLLWSYPNTFFQVHGSHHAPPPEDGLLRGAYGLVGTFTHPQLGTVWTINGNCGEWYLLSEKGFYVARLFEGDPMKMHFPDAAIPGADLTQAPSGGGGEDFGGSQTQAPDGTVYLQSGKIGVWNCTLDKLASIKPLASGTVTLTAADLPLAAAERERQMQAAAGSKQVEVPTLTPKFTGNFNDFGKAGVVSYKKQDDAAVRTGIAWDATCLYLAYEVGDNTPWVNGATDATQLYVSGDTVDFQFGSDPKANEKRAEEGPGDFRLSVGSFQGKPTAVLYRKVSATKQPRHFSSGVIHDYTMDYVAVLTDARIEAKAKADGKSYTVELAVPWATLGFTPTAGLLYRGDFGVTHGDPAGGRTRLRTYWNNQETGLVDDAVFELKTSPRNWGTLKFVGPATP